MDVLTHISEGDWLNVRRNFERLSVLFGAATADSDGFGFTVAGVKARWGATTVTWAGASPFSSFPTVTHGLGKTPAVVIPSAQGGLAGGKRVIATAYSYSSTGFVLDAVTDDRSNPAAATTLSVAWLAIG